MSLKTTTVETFSHPVIAGELIDTKGLPFDDGFFRGEIPVVLVHSPGSKDGRLSSPGALHGRSYELVLSEENGKETRTYNGRAPFEDQYGNAYTTLTTKGNNFSRADIYPSITAPSGYLPWGLQEKDTILRQSRASEELRRGGVDTEWIVRAEEPKQLCYKGEFVEPDEFKRRLVGDLMARSALSSVRGAIAHRENLSDEDIAKISRAIKDMDFFVTLRAMSTADRVQDLVVPSRELLADRVARTFDIYNRVAPYRQTELELLGLPPSLELKPSDDDIMQYFIRILPKLIGYNLALIHNLGLAHKFPHLGNIMTLGGFADVDSVHGAPLRLEDRPVTSDDFMHDMGQIIMSGAETGFGEVLEYWKLETGSEPKLKNGWEVFKMTLQDTYMRFREFDSPDSKLHEELMTQILICSDGDRETLEYYEFQFSCPKASRLINAVDDEVKESADTHIAELTEAMYAAYVRGLEEFTWEHAQQTLYPNSKQPMTKDQVLQALEDSFIVNKDETELVAQFDNAMGGFINSYLEEVIEAGVHSCTNKLTRIIKSKNNPEVIAELQQEGMPVMYLKYAQKLLQDTVEESIVLEAEKFWDTMKKKYREEYLDKFDFAVVPEQDQIQVDEMELEPYAAAWDLELGKLMRAFGGVPLDILRSLLKIDIKPQISKSQADLLTIELQPDEALRLAVIDGDITGCIKPTSEDAERYTGYEFNSADGGQQSTQAIFLIQNVINDSCRTVFKKLAS